MSNNNYITITSDKKHYLFEGSLVMQRRKYKLVENMCQLKDI